MVEYIVKYKEEIPKFIYGDNCKSHFIIEKENLEFFTWSDVNTNEHYLDSINPYMIFAISENKIIGILKLGHYFNETFENKKVYSIPYICVHTKYQGCGIAKNLSHKMFSLARVNDFVLKTTCYSKDGWFKLKPFWNKLSEEYNVKFIDTDDTLTIFNTEDYNLDYIHHLNLTKKLI